MKKILLKIGITGMAFLIAGLFLKACSSDEKVTLTVTVDTTGRTHTSLIEATGAISQWTWSAGDKLYVVSSTGVVGTLEIAAAGVGKKTAVFSGSASITNGENYRFWYAGSNTLADNATSFTLNLSSQTGTLAGLGDFDIMTGAARVYVDGATAHANNLVLSKLMCNACFNITGTDTPTALSLSGSGIYSSVTFNLTTGLATGKSEGALTTTSAFGGDVYLALYPSGSATPTFTVTADGKLYTGTLGASLLSAGSFYRADASSIDGIPTDCVPVGALKSPFSVSATKKVYFSQGNLQYQASSNTWRFAPNQYDYIGDAAGNVTAEEDRATRSAWIDLFGWGTSGYNNKSPYMTSAINEDYGPAYVEGGTDNDIAGTNYDWGVNCAISNGGNITSLWRTLTSDEWSYIFNSRVNAASKWGESIVNGIEGIVLLPDSWTVPGGCTFTAGYGSGFTTNSYTAAQWTTMESAGALFLPAAGNRYGTSVHATGTHGSYWSSTAFGSSSAYGMFFSSSYVIPATAGDRYRGLSVRLAQDD